MNLKNKNPLIVLIAGKARSGKSTIAEYLKEELVKDKQKVIISPYTKYLKKFIEEITEKEITEDSKPRELLQKISSDLIKKELGNNNFFINRQIEDIEVYSYFFNAIIIPDVRFKNEIEVIKEKFNNVISIGVTRKNEQNDLTEAQKKDITETALNNYNQYDFKIDNNNRKETQEKVKKILATLRSGGKI